MISPDRLLSLSVTFRDEPAAAEISPAAANAYLAAKGWRRGDVRDWHMWWKDRYQVMVPREMLADYGRRMVEAINDLAEHEGRSPIAVWVEMKERSAQ